MGNTEVKSMASARRKSKQETCREINFELGAPTELSTDLKFPEIALWPSRGKAFQAEGRASAKALRLSVPGVWGPVWEESVTTKGDGGAGEEPREVAQPGRSHGRTWL